MTTYNVTKKSKDFKIGDVEMAGSITVIMMMFEQRFFFLSDSTNLGGCTDAACFKLSHASR